MIYCVHCGHQNPVGTNFCENCGKTLDSSSHSLSSQQSKPKVKMSKKNKFAIIAVAVLIGLIVIANVAVKKVLDPIKQIEAMDSALKQEDYQAFLGEFQIPEDTIYDAESFFKYVKEDGWGTIRDNLIEEVTAIENGEFADPIRDSYGTELITIVQKKVLLGLYEKVEFKLVPVEVYTDVPFEDIEIIIHDHKVKTDKEGTQLLGQYLPGKYDWSYTYDGKWADLENSGELTIRGYGSNKVEIDIDWNMTSLDLESDIEDAIVYVNGKSTDLTVSEIDTMYPLPDDESIEIYAVAKNAKGEDVKSNIVTSDSRYAYFYFTEEINQEETTAESQKDTYIQKLDSIEAGLANLNDLYTSNDNAEVLQAQKETYKRWDDALNEIYDLLKQQLSSNEMENLKEVQLEWIEEKETAGKNAASSYNDEESKEIAKYKTEAQYTKERCYELVNNYME